MKSRERARIASKVSKILEDSKAVQKGHFISTVGLHLDTYVNKDRLFTDPEVVNIIAQGFARLAAHTKAEVVVGPAIGGAILAQRTAEYLRKSHRRKMLSVFTQKDEKGVQQLKRGYDKDVAGKDVIAVEDILTTGTSLRELVAAVVRAGGNVVGVYAIVNRDPEKVTSDSIGAPLDTLVQMKLNSYEEGEVPPELMKVPIRTDVGHGAAYLAGKKSS